MCSRKFNSKFDFLQTHMDWIRSIQQFNNILFENNWRISLTVYDLKLSIQVTPEVFFEKTFCFCIYVELIFMLTNISYTFSKFKATVSDLSDVVKFSNKISLHCEPLQKILICRLSGENIINTREYYNDNKDFARHVPN